MAKPQPAEPDYPRPARSKWHPALKPLLILVAGLVIGYLIVGFVGAVDWAKVGESLARLNPTELSVLIVLLLARQSFNAVPLVLFVPGLSLLRSLRSDLAAVTSGTFAPPPADIVVRVAMFNSWQISPVAGMAGVTLNMITFYAVRFIAPALGVLVVVHRGVDRGDWLLALASIALAGVILGALLMVMRADVLAALIGRAAARVAGRFSDRADPQAWAAAAVDFRSRLAGTVQAGLAAAFGAMGAMVLVDATMLLLALRFVGIDAATLPWYEVLSAFLLTYPLTILPMFGLGPLDAALIAAFVGLAGIEVEAPAVAAIAVWRSVTLLGPLILGGLVLVHWRAGEGRAAQEWLSDEGPGAIPPAGPDDGPSNGR